jgi:hypothetical protein
MGVASRRNIFLLRVRLVSFWILICNWIPISGRVCCGLSSRPATQPSPTQPSLAQPWPRAPGAPHAPLAPPCTPLPLSHLVFPHSNSLSLSLSSTSLSHLFALGDTVDGYRRFLDPKVSPPLLSSLSLSLPFPLPCERPEPPPPACGPNPLWRRSLLGPRQRGPLPVAVRRPCPSRLARRVPARAALACAMFKFQIN